jgi:hypothetical protein
MQEFWRAASPEARFLARLLAAAPVISLPVLRLLRRTMLPRGDQVHEAEVLLSGLLGVAEGLPPDDPELVRYRLLPGVRPRLLRALPAPDALQVLKVLSSYLNENIGQALDFPAMLDDPTGNPGAIDTSEDPIARLTAEVLRHIGGAYARLVRPADGGQPGQRRRRPPLRSDLQVPWYFERLGIPELWDRGLTGEGVVIGHFFIDPDPDHPWLRGALADYRHFGFERGTASVARPGAMGDGLATALLLVGRPVSGRALGIAPRAKLISAGLPSQAAITVFRLSLEWMADNPRVSIIDMVITNQLFYDTSTNIINDIEQEGILIVLAGGGGRTPSADRTHALRDDLFPVGATDRSDTVAEFLTSQPATGSVRGGVPSVVAPGVDIDLPAIGPDSVPTRRFGTPYAATLIAGLAALLVEAVPEATVEHLKQALLDSCELPSGMSPERGGRGIPHGPRALEILRALGRTTVPRRPQRQPDDGKDVGVLPSSTPARPKQADRPKGPDEDNVAGPPGSTGDQFRGTDRKAAKLSISDAPIESFEGLDALLATLPSEPTMTRHVPPITRRPDSTRGSEERRNVKLGCFLHAAKRHINNDYRLILGKSTEDKNPVFISARVSGLPHEGFDLRLMSSLNDVSGIPIEGKGLIIVAVVNHVLHFRIFDSDGRMVVDTDEQRLTELAQQIEDLRKQLEDLWPPHQLTTSEKGQVTTAVTSIVGPTPHESAASYARLKSARDMFEGFFGRHLPGTSYVFYHPPIPVEVEGSLFFNASHATGPGPGPRSLAGNMPTRWEIAPVTSIKFG